ncbi:hypothetical protein Hdeb2414_s0276g00854431 [Helianthus debilis subsp. tardiflorus]
MFTNKNIFFSVWVNGPLGFGLLLSCRLIQAVHLYCVFIKRRLFPIRSYISLPLALLPWVAWAASKIIDIFLLFFTVFSLHNFFVACFHQHNIISVDMG